MGKVLMLSTLGRILYGLLVHALVSPTRNLYKRMTSGSGDHPPSSQEQLSASFLSKALRLRISEIRIIPIGDSTDSKNGTNSVVCKVMLTFEQGFFGPDSVFGKFSPRSLRGRVNNFLLTGYHEIAAYQDILQVQVRRPKLHYAHVDPWTYDFMSIAEDWSEIAEPIEIDDDTGKNVDYVYEIFANLGRFHAKTWNKPEAVPQWALEKMFPLEQLAVILFSKARRHKFLVAYSQKHQEAVHWYVSNVMATQLEKIRRDPFLNKALIHGDSHAYNIFCFKNSNSVGFVDWQLTRYEDPLMDLGYSWGLLSTVEERRDHEMKLVETYYKALISGGVSEDFTFEQCLERFKVNNVRTVMMHICLLYSGQVSIPEHDLLSFFRKSQAVLDDHLEVAMEVAKRQNEITTNSG